MRHALRAACLWLALIALPGPLLRAQPLPSRPWQPFVAPWFDRTGTADGLPHSVTTAVVQDSRGMIWIGTMGGLVRFDGFQMQLFEAFPGAGSLPDAYVRALLALPGGGMLVGTNAGGLARFDPATSRFTVYPTGANGVADRKIYALASDHAGGVWIATDHGINHLDLATDRLTTLDTGVATMPRNFTVFEDHAGNLWLGNDAGLFVRPAGTRQFVRPAVTNPVASVVLHNQIWALHEDDHGRIWAGSGQAGTAWRDDKGHWHPVPGFSGYPDGESQSTVRAITNGDNGEVWIGTDGDGVLAFRPGETAVQIIAHDAAIPSSLPGDTVRGLLHDATGNLWVATDQGLARTDPGAQTIRSLLTSPLNSRSLADANVHAILVDRRERIWLGLGAGQIDLIDLAHGSLRHLRLGGTQGSRDVLALAEAADGTIWVGTQGLARIDPVTLAVRSDVEPRLDNQPVLSLVPVDGELLIGTYVGAFRYRPQTGELVQFRHDATDPHSLASDTVREIARVGDSIWYGTTAGISIARGAADTGGFRNLGKHDGSDGQLPQDYVGTITSDHKGRLWLATFGGAAMLEPRQPNDPYRFRVFSTEQGLAGNKVNTVIADDRDNIWLSMSKGVSMIDGTTGAVHNLGARDGLHIPSYIYLAAARAPDGSLLFGGLGGLTIVRPGGASSTIPAPAPPVITSTRINGKSLPYGALPSAGQPIVLDRQSRSLQVGFALLDYRAPQETAYSYRMDGFDDGWNEVPANTPPSAVYTNLPYGSYRLHLRAATVGMHPAVVESTFKVTVEPRWYETPWLRALALVGAVALVMFLVHLRTLYLRRRAERLQQQIDERTRDLQEANARLDQLAGTDELTGTFNRRRFLEMTEGVRELAGEGEACLAVLDLDRFKLINDSHGHLAGDAVIRAVADIIVSHCRAGDIVGRYGGEELVVCMPDCSVTEGQRAAERIRDALAATEVNYHHHAIRVTTSIGMAAIRRGDSIEQWLSRADRALYEAKKRGRNCVVVAT